MKNCPGDEDILNFAQGKPAAADEKLALHICSCPACRENFRIALETLYEDSAPDCPLTEEDFRAAYKAVSGSLRSSEESNTKESPEEESEDNTEDGAEDDAEDKLGEILQTIVKTVQENFILSFRNAKIPFLTEGDDGIKVFAAAPSRKSMFGTQKPLPVINFVSTERDFSPYYWKAVLHFPAILQKSTRIRLEITLKDQDLTPEGTMIFRGVRLPVKNGECFMTVDDFSKSMSGRGISFVFPDQHISQGDILL